MLDPHISGVKVGHALADLGHDVAVAERMERLADPALLQMATAESRILVRHNTKDFLQIVQRRMPGTSHAGRLLIPHSVRLNAFGALIAGIHTALTMHDQGAWIDRIEWMRVAPAEGK